MHELARTSRTPVPADREPAHVYLARLSHNSRGTQRDALENIAQIFGFSAVELDWTAIRYPHVVYIRSELMDQYAPSTANRHMAALRGVLKQAWKLGYVSAEDYQRAIDIEPIKGNRLPAGRFIEEVEMERLIQQTQERDTPIDHRDAAILATLYTCGVRRDELVSLDVADYRRHALRVIGKGNKERNIPTTPHLDELIRYWRHFAVNESGSLFTAFDKRLNVTENRLTTQAIWSMLSRRTRRAGLEPLTPHDFRRTFISNLFTAGVDIATIANLAGHADVEQTRRYDRRTEEAKREAVNRLHIPGYKGVDNEQD